MNWFKVSKKTTIFIWMLFISPVCLLADLAILNDGTRLGGYYLKEVENGILFKTLNGEQIKILSSELKKLEVGYNGSNMCITEKNKNTKNCDSLFYKIDKDSIVVAEGEGFLKLRKIPIKDVKKFELHKSEYRPEQLAAKIPRNKNFEFHYEGKKIQGKVLSQKDKKINIKTKDGKIKQLDSENIKLAVYKPDLQKELWDIPWRYLYPGIYQYEQGNTYTGYGLGGGFALSIAGFLVEYQAAVAAASAASGDLTVILFNNDSYLAEFNRHQDMQKLFILGASSIFIYNLIDYLYLDSSESAELFPKYPGSSLFISVTLEQNRHDRLGTTIGLEDQKRYNENAVQAGLTIRL